MSVKALCRDVTFIREITSDIFTGSFTAFFNVFHKLFLKKELLIVQSILNSESMD